ncbi:hypothetical protein ACPYO6_13305 [Georgenia sp. Z1344]|uniref:hypothetical protein n=1 Tax=Georgenia sp. Z1344 TaxID=3416706 RepID=UPI003CEDC22F
MRTTKFLAAPALALGALTLAAAPALAHGDGHDDGSGDGGSHAEGTWSGQAHLGELNNSGTTGDFWLELDGHEATVSMNVSGAAETFMDGPFPHAQHIHIGAEGVCPGPEADMNGDDAVNVEEGHPFYGMIATSLTTEGDTSPDSGLAVDRFPGGSSYTYERTVELDDDTVAALADGTAVVVVHGVDPANLSDAAAGAQSELDPALPLAATLPAACGAVTVSQVGEMPHGGADTGSPVQQSDDGAALAIGAGVLGLGVVGGGAWALKRRAATA